MAKVTWFNIPATDMELVGNFYKSVFGWSIQPLTKASEDALDFQTALTAKSNQAFRSEENGAINGCIIRRDLGLNHPTFLIAVDSLDSALTQVVQAGGSIMRPKTELPEAGGNFAFIKDPEGNVVELWERRTS